MEKIFEQMRDIGIVPVVKIDDAKKAVPLARALIAGGIPAAEVTFRTAAAEEAICCISREFPEMLVGAGTVINVELAKRAVAAGAKFIVSPGFNPDVVDWCIENKIPMIPGVSAPSQVEAALERGLSVLKLFPAEVVGGVAMLDALAGPFGQCMFMPTGGVTTANVGEYAKRKNVLAVGGTWMVKADLINGEKWDEISLICKQALAQLQGFAVGHIGINAEDDSGAEEIAGLLSIFNFIPGVDSKASVFCGDKFEVMKGGGRGVHGHICFTVNNVERALSYVKKFGFNAVDESKKYFGEAGGSPLKFVYLDKLIGGFAVHLNKN